MTLDLWALRILGFGIGLIVAFVIWAALTKQGKNYFVDLYERGHGLDIPRHAKIFFVTHEYGRTWSVVWSMPWSPESEPKAIAYVTDYQRLRVKRWKFAGTILEAFHEETLKALRRHRP